VTETEPPPHLPRDVRHAVIGLGVTQILSWAGVYYAIGATGPAISASLGLAPTLVYGGFSLSLVVGAALAPLVGRSVDRLGGRRVMTTGSLVATLGLALCGLAQGAASWLIACVALGAAVAMTLYEPAFASLVQIAGRQGRRAITLVTLFGGFASTLSWPLTNWLTATFGWREAYFVYAVCMALICLPIHISVLKDAPNQQAFPKPDTEKISPESVTDGTLGGRAKFLAFWLFALVLTANSLVFSGLSAHFVAIFGGLGFDARTAVFVGMMVGPAQVLARLIEMISGARHGALAVGRASAMLLPVGAALLLLVTTAPAAAFGFALAYGLANGLITIAKGAIPLHLFGSSGYGAIIGKLSAPSLAARAAGPLLFASVLERAGVWPLLWICLGTAFIGLISMEFLNSMACRSSVDKAVDGD
jgi:MFS family permease